jgi:Ni/Co efflux regulator RcnB
MKSLFYLLVIALCGAIAQPVLASPPHGKHDKKYELEKKFNKHKHDRDRDRHKDWSKDRYKDRYREKRREEYRKYVRRAYSRDLLRRHFLNYGYRPYKPLPPGIRKNLALGKPLPPGIAKQTLPRSMYGSSLPYYPGYEWAAVGRDLVLIDLTTRLVAELVRDVFAY